MGRMEGQRGNFTSRLYNEEGCKKSSDCWRKVWLFLDSVSPLAGKLLVPPLTVPKKFVQFKRKACVSHKVVI